MRLLRWASFIQFRDGLYSLISTWWGFSMVHCFCSSSMRYTIILNPLAISESFSLLQRLEANSIQLPDVLMPPATSNNVFSHASIRMNTSSTSSKKLSNVGLTIFTGFDPFGYFLQCFVDAGDVVKGGATYKRVCSLVFAYFSDVTSGVCFLMFYADYWLYLSKICFYQVAKVLKPKWVRHMKKVWYAFFLHIYEEIYPEEISEMGSVPSLNHN